MRKLSLILLFLTTFLLVATGKVSAQGPQRYGIKSGIAKQIQDLNGQISELTVYFDDYGRVETTVSKTSYPIIGDIYIKRVLKDGWLIQVDSLRHDSKAFEAIELINFLDISPELAEQYHIEKIGTEKFLDYDCDVYTSHAARGKRTLYMTMYVYKGFILKRINTINKITDNIETIEFLENAEVEPSNFEYFDIKK